MKRLVYFRKPNEFRWFDDSEPFLDTVDFNEFTRYATSAELLAYQTGRKDKAAEVLEALARERFALDKEQL